MNDYLLSMEGIDKRFSGAYALRNVNFNVKKGEVHALLGENGAGKSTLIKILMGVYPKDGGKIFYNGKEVEINSRTDAAKLGIAVIFQELSLLPTLTVTQNIMLGKEKGSYNFLDKKGMYKEVTDLIHEHGFMLNADDTVETLSVAQKQMVEIIKALSENASLIVMDEPTSSLSGKETEILFSIINRLKEKGVSVLYISHRLEEIFRIADRITVLRDGKNVATSNRNEVSPAEIIRMMIGKELNEVSASHSLRTSDQEIVLDVHDLTSKGYFEDVSFSLHKGEVLVVTGLVGSGRTELLRSIFGADPYDSGEIVFEGKKLKKGVKAAMKAGFGLIPEDRRTQGFSPLLSIVRNIASTNYDKLSRAGIVNDAKEKKLGAEAVKQLDIRPGNPAAQLSTLSGGNQQKVVLGKWLTRDHLSVLLVDEPTVGIDIGAKDEIYKIIERIAQSGVSVLLVSSDLAEVLRVAHRILIMHNGRMIDEFSSGKVTQEDILLASSGIHRETEAARQ